MDFDFCDESAARKSTSDNKQQMLEFTANAKFTAFINFVKL